MLPLSTHLFSHWSIPLILYTVKTTLYLPHREKMGACGASSILTTANRVFYFSIIASRL
jgi:hypothetical protein